MEAPEKYIDLKKVIESKKPTLARWMPGFMLKYLKRIIHQEEINEIMSRKGHLEGLAFVDAILTEELNTTIKLVGRENIPKTGGVIIASNHPLGGLDGMALMKAMSEVRTDFQFLVNDILLNLKNLESLFVPVNKVGDNPRKATKIIEESYAKDIAILIFPAGLVSRKLNEGVRDLEWKKSFIGKAKKYQKDVVPVHIDGRNSNFFYNLSRWRTKLGIKANIEMLYLVDEMFRQRNKTITIHFGKPIPHETFDQSKTPSQWAREVQEKAYALRKELE